MMEPLNRTLIICLYDFILCSCFFLSHNKKRKVFFLFHGMFYLTMVLIAYCSILYLQDRIWISFIMSTLVFIIAEYHHHSTKKIYDQLEIEHQNKLVRHHIDEVQSIYLTMREWRHDYHNHMQTLKAHMAMAQYDLANQYLDELEKDLNDIRIFIKSGNINLDAILNSKLSLAKSKNIAVNCKAELPSKLTISDIDLCVLIGNLLDNALEACEQMPCDEEPFLRIYIGVFKQQLYISVANATKELTRKLDHEYTTNKRGNHGHGLKRIYNTVKKYEGFINSQNEPGVFITEIMLPL